MSKPSSIKRIEAFEYKGVVYRTEGEARLAELTDEQDALAASVGLRNYLGMDDFNNSTYAKEMQVIVRLGQMAAEALKISARLAKAK